MLIHRHNVPLKKATDYVDVVFHGDWHLGTSCCHIGCIKSMINRVAEAPDAKLILMGDLGDFIMYKDKRFSAAILDPRMSISTNILDWTKQQIKELLSPLADQNKLIAMLTGNHEETAFRDFHQNPIDIIADHMHTVNLGYSGFVKLCFKYMRRSKVVDIYLNHGRGNARTDGGKINTVHAYANQYNANIYAMGHVHKVHSDFVPTLSASNGNNPILVADNKYFLLTGSALKAHLPGTLASSCSTYVERASFPPVALGWVELRIWPWGGKNGGLKIESRDVSND